MKFTTKIYSLEIEHKVAAIALLLIPFFTITFATLKPPTQYTLSMIGNRFDKRLEFVIWGLVTGILLVFLIGHLFKLGAFKHKKASALLIRSGICLVITVLVPAFKEVWPILSKIHALFASLFSFFLIASMFYFLRYIRQYNKKLGRVSILLFMLVICGSLLCLFILGGTGIFELFFFISFSLFLFFLWYIIGRERKKHYQENL